MKKAHMAILEGRKVKVISWDENPGEINLEALKTWGQWFEKADRRVRRDTVGDADISTVFLGINHSWNNERDLWFESMVFGGAQDGVCIQYETWEEAEEGHKALVKLEKKYAWSRNH